MGRSRSMPARPVREQTARRTGFPRLRERSRSSCAPIGRRADPRRFVAAAEDREALTRKAAAASRAGLAAVTAMGAMSVADADDTTNLAEQPADRRDIAQSAKLLHAVVLWAFQFQREQPAPARPCPLNVGGGQQLAVSPYRDSVNPAPEIAMRMDWATSDLRSDSCCRRNPSSLRLDLSVRAPTATDRLTGAGRRWQAGVAGAAVPCIVGSCRRAGDLSSIRPPTIFGRAADEPAHGAADRFL